MIKVCQLSMCDTYSHELVSFTLRFSYPRFCPIRTYAFSLEYNGKVPFFSCRDVLHAFKFLYLYNCSTGLHSHASLLHYRA